MALFSGTIEIALGLLIGIALMNYSGYMKHLKRELGYLASAATFLLVAAVLPAISTTFPTAATGVAYINMIFIIIAFVLVLIGAITMAVSIFSKLKP